MSVNIEDNGELTANGDKMSLDSNKMNASLCIDEKFPDHHVKTEISSNIERSKPSFLTDKVWTEYQRTFPWLYHSEGKFRCSFCEEAFKGDRGMSWSISTSLDKSKNLLDDVTKIFDVSHIRFERHGASQNHSLAGVILGESNKTTDDWQTLKLKYDWLEGSIDTTRCSVCEQAYQKHKQAMLVTIWTCPELRNQQSTTRHFSTSHKLDRHEKCNNHLLAVSLKSSDIDSNSSKLTRSHSARNLSITNLSPNKTRSHSATNSPINRFLTQTTLSTHKTRSHNTSLSFVSRSSRRRSFSQVTQTSIKISMSPDKSNSQSGRISPMFKPSQKNACFSPNRTRSQSAQLSPSTQICLSPMTKPTTRIISSTITLPKQEICMIPTAQQSQETEIKLSAAQSHISILSESLLDSKKNTEKPKDNPSLVKRSRSPNIVLPLAISPQLFKNLKLRFPWVNSRDATSLMCEQCREPNSHIMFDLNSSLSLISRRILGHFNSEIHQHSARNDSFDTSEKATRSARGPKIDYRRLSSGKETIASSVGPWSCPQCKSNFAHKVGLIHHVSVCDRQSSEERRQLDCPCEYGPSGLSTIAEVDLHVAREHSDRTFFHCHLCSDRYCRLLTLFEHVLVHHLVEWDPFAPPPPPPSECILCNTTIATNVLLIEHYQRSACKKLLQPVVLIEKISPNDDTPSDVAIEIINLIKDDDTVSQQEHSPAISLKKEDRSLFSQMSSEIIVAMNTKESTLIEVPPDEQLKPISLAEEPPTMETPEEPLLPEISSSEPLIEISSSEPLIEISSSEPLIEISSKEENISIEEDITNKLVHNNFEIILLDCVKGDPSVLEKMMHVIDKSEELRAGNPAKSAGYIGRGRPKKLITGKVHNSDSSRRNSIAPEPKKRESTVILLNRKRRRVPSEKIRYGFDSNIKPMDSAKRIRVPSEKLRESVYFDMESLDTEKRVRPPSSKLKELTDSPEKKRRKRRTILEIRDAKQLLLCKNQKTNENTGASVTKLNKPNVDLDAQKSKNKTFEEALNYVQTNKRSMMKSLKVAKMIKRSKDTDLKLGERKPVLMTVSAKAKLSRSHKKSLEATKPELDTPTRPVPEVVVESTPPETVKARKPVVIQSQVSPLSMQMLGDLPDSELIPSSLSFMDRMKRIRQLKKMRSQQQREQMMAVDQTVAEIREHGDSSCLKSKEIKKLLTCEQYSMDDLKNILHKASKKRKLEDQAEYHPSKRIKLDSPKRPGAFPCDLCLETFSSQRTRDKHASIEHRGAKMFKCQACGVSRATHSILRKHVLRCHKEDASYALYGEDNHVDIDMTFQCHFCEQQFTSKAGLNVHVSRAHRPSKNKQKPLVDIESNGPSPVVDDFLVKLKEADPVNIGQLCPVCNDVMNNEFELAIHVVEHEREKGTEDLRFACPECCRLFFGKEGKMYLKDHYNIVHLSKPLPSCDECNTDFPSTWCYYEHKRVMKDCATKLGLATPPLLDPYESLNEEHRMAFVCSRCQTLVAGESAQLRFDVHLVQCGLQVDEDSAGPAMDG